MCADSSTDNLSNSLNSEKSGANQRPKTCLCPDCGVVVALAATGAKRKRCAQCAADAARARARRTAEKIRRAKGVAPVKNTQIKCVDCSLFFTRNNVKQTRCEQCQYAYVLAKANEVSRSKPRAYRIGDKTCCKNCSAEYTIKAVGNLYCEVCQPLSKKNQLPHLAEKMQVYKKKYFSDPKNKRKALDKQNAWKRKKVKQDPVYCLVQRVRARLRSALKLAKFPKKGTTQQIIGCTWEELARHIELQFTKGMTWDNRQLWHIDHIVPLASAKTEDDVLRLSHYTNLRPLWAEDNLRKRDEITHLL